MWLKVMLRVTAYLIPPLAGIQKQGTMKIASSIITQFGSPMSHVSRDGMYTRLRREKPSPRQ